MVMLDPDGQFPSRAEVGKCSASFVHGSSEDSVAAAAAVTNTCVACNGFYGPAFSQPVCATCHAFLYANDLDAEINLQLLSDGDGADIGHDSDRDSGNEEEEQTEVDGETDSGVAAAMAVDVVTVDPALDVNEQPEANLPGVDYDIVNMPEAQSVPPEEHEHRAERPLLGDAHLFQGFHFGEEHLSPLEADHRLDGDSSRGGHASFVPFVGSSSGRSQGWPNRMSVRVEALSERLAMLTFARPGDGMSEGIAETLPPEVLLVIFSFLDDISLYAIGSVCRRWNSVLRSQVTSDQWQVFTRRRWPLFRPIGFVRDWFSTYSALVESSFCLTCIYQMAEIPADFDPVPLREKRLSHDLRGLITDPPEGIKAQPLDSSNYHWQASITGPAGSPYEGGIFFLYLKVPFTHPFDAPEVRFLTRIFHPNVSRHGDIGIDSILPHNWVSGLTIPKVLISIQSLLTDPYVDVCMEPDIGALYREDRKMFDAVARRWTWQFAMHDAIPPKPKI